MSETRVIADRLIQISQECQKLNEGLMQYLQKPDATVEEARRILGMNIKAEIMLRNRINGMCRASGVEATVNGSAGSADHSAQPAAAE